MNPLWDLCNRAHFDPKLEAVSGHFRPYNFKRTYWRSDMCLEADIRREGVAA